MEEGGIGPEIRERIEEIRNDREHGAGFLTLKVLTIVDLLAKQSRAKDRGEFQRELGELKAELSMVRPTMCSIANAISSVTDSILTEAEGKGVEELKVLAIVEANHCQEELQRRSLLACYKAADLITTGDGIMTASYSSQIVCTFKKAKDMGKAFTVFVLQSLSQERSYGQVLTSELQKGNIEALIIPDDDITHYISRANKVLVGADAILPQGYVVNGVPSLRLARVAQRNHLPFYVVGEMIKVSPRFFEPDHGFDVIPPELITQIITDE